MAHRGILPQFFSFLKGKQESKQVSGETRQFGFGCHCFQEWSGETGCPVCIGSCICFSQGEEPSFPGKLRSSGMASSLENPSRLTAGHSQAAPRAAFRLSCPEARSAHFGKHQPLSIYINFSVYYTQTVKKLFYWYLVFKTSCIWPPNSFLFSFVFSMA